MTQSCGNHALNVCPPWRCQASAAASVQHWAVRCRPETAGALQEAPKSRLGPESHITTHPPLYAEASHVAAPYDESTIPAAVLDTSHKSSTALLPKHAYTHMRTVAWTLAAAESETPASQRVQGECGQARPESGRTHRRPHRDAPGRRAAA